MQTNPVKAIREKCLECSNGSIREVELCPVTGCALYPFRFGKNPYRKQQELTAEQQAARLERIEKYNSTRRGTTNSGLKSANPPAEGKFTSEVD